MTEREQVWMEKTTYGSQIQEEMDEMQRDKLEAYTMSIQQIWLHSGPLSNSTLLIKWLICCLIDESRGGKETEEHFESQR